MARLRDALASVDGVRVAYLFGSRARGNARASSDIDVAVEFDRALDAAARHDAHLDVIAGADDLAYHVASDAGWPSPANGRDAFALLGSHGVIAHALAERLGKAAGLRNLLVHDHVPIKHEMLARMVRSDLGDLRSFGVAIAALLPPAPATE